ncbi:organic cation transporter protein-like [Babylonia areolata]|uniref:organic cation transporter protein-like n=1 Tax=Babylonia areolata TaxID=304850 RepID=UPI003FCF985D
MPGGTEVDDVLDQLGGYGRYQVWVYVALGLVNMRGAWHVFVSMFTGWTPAHHCTPPANHTLNQSLPLETDDYGTTTWSKCKMYAEPGTNSTPNGHDTVSCQHGWTYVWDSEGETSIVGDWDLVCDDKYLAELSVTMYMVGATCGTLFLTPLSDLWGRKTVMLACLWLQAVVGACLTLCRSVAPYIVLQFFIGICNMTIALCAYVLIVETFDKSTREWPALSLQFFWAGGIMLLSLLAYLLPDWRHLELVVSLPQLLTVTYYWYGCCPSPLTWLLIKGKTERAKKVILTILRVNRLPPIPDLDKTLSFFSRESTEDGNKGDPRVQATKAADDKADERPVSDGVTAPKDDQSSVSYTVLDLFKTRRICRYTLCMCYLYLVNSLAYFGISFFTPLLNGDKYLNTFISGVVEVPAYIVCIICNRKIGRRWPILGFLLICAAGNIAVIFIPDVSDSGKDLSSLKTGLVMVGKFGITGSYAALYLYGTEIFPTSIRNHAVGVCSFFENIGSIAAPQIVLAAKSIQQLPTTIFGVMTVVGALLVLLLPETHKRPLPQTMEEAEHGGTVAPRKRSKAANKYYVNSAMDSSQPE